MDVTIISLAPYQIKSFFPGCQPSEYYIPEASLNDFSLSIISRAIQRTYIDDERGYLETSKLAEEIADSIINDHISSCINISSDASPGLFKVSGAFTDKKEIIKKFPLELQSARDKQKAWFIALVEQADYDWSKTKSPRSISDLQKKAATFLNLKREWDIEQIVESITLCPSCKTHVHPQAFMCQNCKFILNKEEYNKNKENFGGFIGATR